MVSATCTSYYAYDPIPASRWTITSQRPASHATTTRSMGTSLDRYQRGARPPNRDERHSWSWLDLHRVPICTPLIAYRGWSQHASQSERLPHALTTTRLVGIPWITIQGNQSMAPKKMATVHLMGDATRLTLGKDQSLIHVTHVKPQTRYDQLHYGHTCLTQGP